MANEAHLKILKCGVEEWNIWRMENPEVSPDLNELDLSGKDLSLADLQYTDLRNTQLSNANLEEANLHSANLSGAILINANLNRANLRHAHLNNTNLKHSDLSNADLSSAILKNVSLDSAKLKEANLTGAHFIHVNLNGANLKGADLRATTLEEADLNGANFSSVQIGRTKLGAINLSGVRQLEKVKHNGPSEVSLSTFSRSSGVIPESFLRGCGLSNWELELVKLYQSDRSPIRMSEILYKISDLLTDPLIQFYSCFISYSHSDKSFAHVLHDTLQGRGVRCWLDEHQLLPGDDIFEQVDRGIRLWDKVLLCCSKDSLKSWWVDDEITKAYEKEQALMEQRGEKVLALIPLNLDGHLFSGKWKSGKASQIKSRLAADFTGWEQDNQKFDEQFERLVKALRTDGGRELPPQQKL